MQTSPLLQAHRHHITHREPVLCTPLLLHEMLSSVDEKLSEASQSAAAGAAIVKEGEDPRALDGLTLAELLLRCVQSLSRQEVEQSVRILNHLAGRLSANGGDSSERIALYFGRALARRISRYTASTSVLGEEFLPREFREERIGESQVGPSLPRVFRIPESPSRSELHAAYLALNRVSPFLRFAHFTANQAIVEVMEGEGAIHLVDFEIMQGVQWSPLMQALAQRDGGPPFLRLTGIGSAEDVLNQTGRRLREFAHSLQLPFEYNALVVSSIDSVTEEMFDKREGEAFAVNIVLQLHRLLEKGVATLDTFLETIHSLSPKVVTLAEREASHNQEYLLDRFTEAFRHYTALFDSLEATLPPRSYDRVLIEEIWFGPEIANIVAYDGADWTERHQRFEQWREAIERAGFQSLPPSTFALAQAKLLLRLHYPSEGYRLFENEDSLLLGWRDQALFSVSSWQTRFQLSQQLVQEQQD